MGLTDRIIALIYGRVSSDESAERGHSIAFQLEECRRYAKQLGATQILEFTDEGVSGVVLERPGLQAMLERLRQGDVAFVVIWDPDRLSRNLGQQLILSEQIEKYAKLRFVKFEMSDTPEGQLFYQLRGAIAQYEREKIRERMMAGKRQKARSGKLPYRVEPYGYRYDPETSTISIDEEEAAVIRRIFREYVELRYGLNGIARGLARDGVPTRRGGRWHRQVVRQIIMNPVYMGVYWANRRDMTGVGLNKYRRTGKVWARIRPEEEWIPVQVPAIIEPEVWYQAQEIMKRSKQLWSRHRETYLLSGLIRCAECGNTMTGKNQKNWGKRVRVYTCRKNTVGAKNPGCGQQIRADQVEEQVWSRIEGWLNDPDELLAYLETPDTRTLEAELADVEAALNKAQAAQRQLLLVLERQLADSDQVLESLERIKERIANLISKREALRAQLSGSVQAWKESRDSLRQAVGTYIALLRQDASIEVRQQIVRQFVVSVEVSRHRVTIRAKLPAISAPCCHEKGDYDDTIARKELPFIVVLQ